MTETTLKRFGLSDLMILVAASGAAIAWTIAAYGEALAVPERLGWAIRSREWVEATHPALHSIGVVLVLIRLRSPRPPLRLLALQPGFVAAAATSLPLLIDAAFMLTTRTLKPVILAIVPPLDPAFLVAGSASMPLIDLASIDPGPAIVVAWLLLVAIGIWKPEPDWADRLGRGLGVAWIVDHIADLTLTNLIVG